MPGGRVLSRNSSPRQPADALLGKATLPAPDRRPTYPDTPCHLENRQALGRKENNLGPLNMLVRTAPVAGDRGQSRTILGSQNHADILCHDQRIAWLSEFVNPLNAAVH